MCTKPTIRSRSVLTLRFVCSYRCSLWYSVCLWSCLLNATHPCSNPLLATLVKPTSVENVPPSRIPEYCPLTAHNCQQPRHLTLVPFRITLRQEIKPCELISQAVKIFSCKARPGPEERRFWSSCHEDNFSSTLPFDTHS